MNRGGPRQDWQVAVHLLLRCTLRHWWSAKWSYLAILAIVALGVGSFNGIRQSRRAATANFGLFNEAISGRSDFIIRAPVGAIQSGQLRGLADLGSMPDWHLLPVIEGPLTQLNANGQPERLLRLIGIDLLAVSNLPAFIDQGFDFELAGYGGGLGRQLNAERTE